MRKSTINGHQLIIDIPVNERPTLRDPQRRTLEQVRDMVPRLRQAIFQHLSDQFPVVLSGVWWRLDKTETCEHCGAKWTEESPDYNGGCCEKDEAANPANIVIMSDGK